MERLTAGSRLERVLRSGRFAVTAELNPPDSADPQAVYERALVLPDGPERAALFRQAQRIAVAYMPYKIHAHRVHTDLCHPWVFGFRRPLFGTEWWHMVDVDMNLRARHTSGS